MNVASLGYITLNVQDLSAWKTFGSDVLGLMLNADMSDDNNLFFRMDDHPSRLVIQKADEDKLLAIGWEFASAEDFESAIEAIQSSGATVQRGDSDGASLRNVVEYASSADPSGNPFEIYHSRTNLSDDFSSPLDIRAFVTGDMGMGHAVIPAPNTDETHNFYKDVLGFADSDNLTLPPPAEGAPEMNIRFMHAANPRHHSLALFNFPNPVGLVHLILEVGNVDEVGACLDRVTKGDYPLMATLGRHCNDNMLSFYVVGPGGFAVEYGCEGAQIDFENYTPTVSTVGDFWGHDYVPPAV
jgi:3,4-dihydroxy-9,10-secoandrosta-1,3,5(10)-triene-9,17-dione 4,5-dioxygenase